MILILLVVATFVCGLQALRARQLLICALWLAAVSALVAITFYQLGAPEAAAIELSVGAGLVTVLFVFAISMAGAGGADERPLLPRPLAWALVGLAAALLGWFILRPAEPLSPTAGASFAEVMWQQRSLDVPVQVMLIFSGVLGVLDLLADPAPRRVEARERGGTQGNSEELKSLAILYREKIERQVVPPVVVEPVSRQQPANGKANAEAAEGEKVPV